MTDHLLKFDNVSMIFKIGGGLGLFGGKRVVALNDVSFTIPDKPGIVALVGESGSGKSTIARLALGLLRPTVGQVLYRGREISEWLKSDKYRFRREVQAVFQDPYGIYNPYYKVDRVLYLALRKLMRINDREYAQSLIVNAMKTLGMRPEEVLGRYPHQLSGGERQRLMLVLSLLIKPRLLIADEPVSMIDASLRAIFLENLLELKKTLGISCLYITHDLITANYVADEIIVLCHGKIVEIGDATNVIRDPLHPYTKLLVDSMLLPDPRAGKAIEAASIDVRSLSELKPEKGCVFRYRCPYAMKVCVEGVPDLIEVGDGRKVACYLYGEQASSV
ncbi:Oligopeptide transport ATP-binding protein OppD [Candidatus Calditenuaceae archaeon HR02]|nr:Oligopeptide transport ATP-binding protein OppD [Candidatus Calditenuaceae archaeon HR02]